IWDHAELKRRRTAPSVPPATASTHVVPPLWNTVTRAPWRESTTAPCVTDPPGLSNVNRRCPVVVGRIARHFPSVASNHDVRIVGFAHRPAGSVSADVVAPDTAPGAPADSAGRNASCHARALYDQTNPNVTSPVDPGVVCSPRDTMTPRRRPPSASVVDPAG